MINNKKKDAFLEYINEYIVFLDEMIEIQKRQLDAVVGASVKEVEKIKEVDKTVVEIQGYTVRMDIMEQKRLEIQQQVGFNDMTFGEIIEFVDDSKKHEYTIVLEKFKKNVDNIVFYSRKIHDKVQSDLNIFNSVVSQTTSYNSNKQQVGFNKFGSSLQIKT